MLEFDARIAARDFDVQLSVATGETLAILGPNGAGKSTLLNCLAGLIRPDSGSARLDDTTLFDLGGDSRAIWSPPYSRGVSLLAQQAMLFPHLSVIDNVAFGPTSARVPKGRAREVAAHWLNEVDASEFAARKPAQLSGGQAQRVAVARALASSPKLLLLDEPMAALDITMAPTLRSTLRRVLQDRTVIVVTHDVLDAFTLADRVAVMRNGRIIESGPTRDVFERPRSTFTAALVGLNLVTGASTARGLVTDEGMEISVSDPLPDPLGSQAALTVSPLALQVSPHRPEDLELNVFESRVIELEPRGDLVRVHVEHFFADVPPSLVAALDLVPGLAVWVSFAPTAATIYSF